MEKRNIIVTRSTETLELSMWGSEDNPHPIDKLIDFLTKSKDNGNTHIDFEGYMYDDTLDEIELVPVKIVEETDEEYNKRIAEAQAKVIANEQSQKELRYKQYLALKEEFENA